MRIVLRIGGSVVASPAKPSLIGEYVELLKSLKKERHDVAAVVGGGALAREFIRTAKELGLTQIAQDEVAISISRVYAQLFLLKLGDLGCKTVPVTIKSAADSLRKGKAVVMGGLKPGMTTDTVAALIADHIQADLLVKGTDQDGIYDKDPRKFSDAVLLESLSYEELPHVLLEDRHKAGIHQIIDPEAIKILVRSRVKVVVVNGFRPVNVLMAVEGKRVGTLIA